MKLNHLMLCLIVILAFPAKGMAACDHVSAEWLNAQVPLPPDARIVHTAEKMGVCEVVLAMDGDLVPVYVGKDWLLAGQMFSGGKSVTRETMDSLSHLAEEERQMAKEQEALAREKRKLFFRDNAGQMDDMVSLTFGPASATSFVYVVTDPNCSHCKSLLLELETVAFEARVTLKLIIYPVLGAKSRDMAARAICESLDWEGYKTVSQPNTHASCDRADQRIQKTMAFMQMADVSFVPMVVAGDGAWVVEGNKIGDIRTCLGLKSEAGQESGGQGCAAPEKE
jgi:thiol:disulfide interchange protein DsbC